MESERVDLARVGMFLGSILQERVCSILWVDESGSLKSTIDRLINVIHPGGCM